MNNMALQLQKNNNNDVLDNNNVIFDEIISMLGNISYDNMTGVITISENGLYVLDWYVATQTTAGSPSVIFKLISDKGNEFESNSPNKTGNMSGIAFLDVDNAPLNISLVNTSGATVFFPSEVLAKTNLRIFSLNSSAVDNSRCFALEQFAHVLEQIVTIYQGASVSIFSNRLSTVLGRINSLYKAPDVGSIPLLLISDSPYAFTIDKITMLHLTDSVYDDSITYLNPPDPFPQNCDTDLIKNIYNYVEVGDEITITTGPASSANGTVRVNEYGIMVIADDVSTIFLLTPQIFSIVKSDPTGDMSGQKAISVSAINE